MQVRSRCGARDLMLPSHLTPLSDGPTPRSNENEATNEYNSAMRQVVSANSSAFNLQWGFTWILRSNISDFERPVELGRSPGSPISVALGAVKREQLDNLVHARTTVHAVRSHIMNAFELTVIACL